MPGSVPSRQRIAIVGFGVAGAMAGTLLARAGHEVHVFERAARLTPVGAGLLLQPAGQAVLARAGLLTPILASAEPIAAVRAYTHTRRTLVHLPYPRAGGVDPASGVRAHALGVHRADLFSVLHGAAVAAGVVIHLDHPIASCDESPASVMLNDERGGKHGPFDVALAADGARSTVRASLPCNPRSYDHGAAWAVGPCTAVRDHLLQVTHGTARLAGLLPTGRGRCSLFWGLPLREFPRGRALPGGAAADPVDFPTLKSQVLSLMPEAAEVFETATSLDAFTFTTYTHVHLPRWHTDRLCLLGDAAHASSPHLGQGVNLALLDAEALAVAVDRCGGDQVDWASAFTTYESFRRRHQRYYTALTHFLTPFFQSDGRVRGLIRNATLPVFPRVPIVRRLMLKTLAGSTKAP